jgi:hypothetical protein
VSRYNLNLIYFLPGTGRARIAIRGTGAATARGIGRRMPAKRRTVRAELITLYSVDVNIQAEPEITEQYTPQPGSGTTPGKSPLKSGIFLLPPLQWRLYVVVGEREKFLVHPFSFIEVGMQINFGGLDRGMTKVLLHHAKVL